MLIPDEKGLLLLGPKKFFLKEKEQAISGIVLPPIEWWSKIILERENKISENFQNLSSEFL